MDFNHGTGQLLRLLAWSPDRRYVAYAVPVIAHLSSAPVFDLAILDLDRDTSVRYPGLTPLTAASFAPTAGNWPYSWTGPPGW